MSSSVQASRWWSPAKCCSCFSPISPAPGFDDLACPHAVGIIVSNRSKVSALNAPPGPDKSEKKWQFVRHIRASDVDPADPPALYRDFVSFLEEHCTSPAHYVRYCQTFLGMVPFLDEVPGRRVLETGSFSFISRFLGEQGFKFRKSHSDLRY